MKVLAIVPARYESSRLPGKPLKDIGGKTMISRVVEQVSKSSKVTAVCVATDDKRIFQHLESEGKPVVMTSVELQSGTDRCAQALESMSEEYDVVLNIQGDEPFIQPEQIDKLIGIFEKHAEAQIGTLIKPITSGEEMEDPNKPKVVVSKNGRALYFTRQTIPYQRGVNLEKWGEQKQNYYRHVGVYGFRSTILPELAALQTSMLEEMEALEQLRWLENDYSIFTEVTTYDSLGVDTPEDLEKAHKWAIREGI